MRIVLIGAGNLATQLGLVLSEKSHRVVQVFSRTEESASELSEKLGCAYTISPDNLIKEADIYIIAVKDYAIEPVLQGIGFDDKLMIHTSGSVPMEIFEPYCKNYGVLYPLQTFSKNQKADFSGIPLLVEANNEENLRVLEELASGLSEKVLEVNSEKRKQVHLAAVFACNFVNHFYFIADELLKNKDLNPDLLYPLITETASKAVTDSPDKVQTGPAVRNEKTIMEEHLKMLGRYPEWERLYQLISENIYNTHKKT